MLFVWRSGLRTRYAMLVLIKTVQQSIYEDYRKSKDQEEFTREYELENENCSIFLTQKKIGDESCVVWDAALVLAKYLEIRTLKDKTFLQGKSVLELGSGLGCVGLVAAYYGANVTVTDLQSCLPTLQANVDRNKGLCGNTTVIPLDWKDVPELKPSNILLLADCVYYMESVDPLINTMELLSSSTTDIYLSQENRSYSEIQDKVWNYFLQKVQEVFKVVPISQRDQHEQFRSADIYLFHLKKNI